MKPWGLNDFLIHQGPNTKAMIFLPKVESICYDDRTDTLTIYMGSGTNFTLPGLQEGERNRIMTLWTQTMTRER